MSKDTCQIVTILLLMAGGTAFGQSSVFDEYQKRKAMVDSIRELNDGQLLSILPGKRMAPKQIKLFTGNVDDPLLAFHETSLLGKKLIDKKYLCVFVRCKAVSGEGQIYCIVFRFDYNVVFQAIWFVDRYLLGIEPVQIRVDKSSIALNGKSVEQWKFNARGKLTKNGE
jgi:hypothetical protein